MEEWWVSEGPVLTFCWLNVHSSGFQIIWFNLFLGGGIKLVLRIVHFAVASRRLRSRIKLENCSFGRLRRMHNADLYPFDCHRCGLKEPWHCLSVWSWHILKVHWEENKVGIEVLVLLVRLNMVVICLIVSVALIIWGMNLLAGQFRWSVDEAVYRGC